MKNTIKHCIKKAIQLYYFERSKSAERKQYRLMLAKNNIINEETEGEQLWIKRWTLSGGVKPGIECYRLFKQYLQSKDSWNIVSDIVCSTVIEPILNPIPFRAYYADKNVFDIILPSGYFPKTYLRRMNGFYYDSNYNRLITNEECSNVLKSHNGKWMVVKPTIGGISGKGVKVFLCNNSISIDNINNFEGNDYIIQEKLEQHQEISKYNETSINTIRIAIYKSILDDSVHILNAVLRIGSEGSKVDNAHQGGRFVKITSDGKLGKIAFNQYGESVKVFNGIDFSENHEIPNWERICDFAKSVCQYVPHHRLLALDCVIKKDGSPCLLEFNIEGFSMWFFQFTGNNAFASYTEEILNYCREKIKNIE